VEVGSGQQSEALWPKLEAGNRELACRPVPEQSENMASVHFLPMNRHEVVAGIPLSSKFLRQSLSVRWREEPDHWPIQLAACPDLSGTWCRM
jgi:hypothetical protein